MYFLLQKENNEYTVDVKILKDILDNNRYLQSYDSLSLEELKTKDKHSFMKNFLKEAIPIGTIEFVNTWLNIYTQVTKQNPIEIPNCLRKEEFLKRKYSIITYDKIPNKGRYFLKDVSELKAFSYVGNLENLMDTSREIDSSFELNANHLYQLSEEVDILSEYRVYIIRGEIQTIAHYNGDPCIFPDINLIQKANSIYSLRKDYPNSYTMDIMVTDRGTSIIELHTFLSTGLYTTLFGNNLVYAYRDGLDYIKNCNTEIKPIFFKK